MVNAASDGTQALASAGIAAVVALVVAVLGQLNARARDRAARAYDRRREALVQVQDAALTLRQRLRDYGALSRTQPGLRTPELTLAERGFDDARAALEVMITRVDDAVIRMAILAWQADAEVRFISAQDVSAAQEQEHWQHLNDTVGRALQSPTGQS